LLTLEVAPGYRAVWTASGVTVGGCAGATAGITLNGPVLDAIATPSGLGYYMVASDGGIFNFSDQPFLGSLGATSPASPIVSVALSS
jgi:hypothetical protein